MGGRAGPGWLAFVLVGAALPQERRETCWSAWHAAPDARTPGLSVGIGRPSGSTPIASYVLQDFSKAEREEIDVAIQVRPSRRLLSGAAAIVAGGWRRWNQGPSHQTPTLPNAGKQEGIDMLRSVLCLGMDRAVSGVRVDRSGHVVTPQQPQHASSERQGRQKGEQQQEPKRPRPNKRLTEAERGGEAGAAVVAVAAQTKPSHLLGSSEMQI